VFFGLFKTIDEKIAKVKYIVDSGKSDVVRYPTISPNAAYLIEAIDRYSDKAVAKHFLSLMIDEIINKRL